MTGKLGKKAARSTAGKPDRTRGEPGFSKADLADAYRFFNEINIIAQLSTNQMDQRMPHGLNPSQFGVLNWFVRVDDEATPGRLARAFQVSKGAMTNTLTKLEGKGFVSISPDPTSGRRKLVRLSPSGRSARDAAVAATYPLLEDFLRAFDIAMIRGQLPQLERIRAFLDNARDATPAPVSGSETADQPRGNPRRKG